MVAWVQSVPFHSHVSCSSPPLPKPPKTTETCRPESYARRVRSGPAGTSQEKSLVQSVPFHSHVSLASGGRASARRTAEEHHHVPARVVGHHVSGARDRARRRILLGPRGAVPGPRVVQRLVDALPPEEDRDLVQRVVRLRLPAAQRRARRGKALAPLELAAVEQNAGARGDGGLDQELQTQTPKMRAPELLFGCTHHRVSRAPSASRLSVVEKLEAASTTYLRGAERDRTVGLLNAIEALSQLSYSPRRRLPGWE